MVTLTAYGVNGFVVTVDESAVDGWIRRARRIGCGKVEIAGGSNPRTVFFQ